MRMRAVELENKSLVAQIDSMSDKLCFCVKTEANAQVSLPCFGVHSGTMLSHLFL